MIYEMAVADAFAIPFEFIKDPSQHGLVNDLVTYQQHPEYAGLLPSQYTDDTQRSIANARTVLEHCTHDLSAFVRSLQRVFREDPRDGYSRNFQQFMIEQQHAYPLDWMREITLRRATNGSIMGVAPIGYLRDPVDVRLGATLQAITTHSVETAPYAQTLALAAHYFIYDLGSRDHLPIFLVEEAEGAHMVFDGLVLDEVPQRVKMSARATTHAVLKLLMQHNSLSDLLRQAVNVGGDTDSVAALSVGIASCSDHYANDLPQVLIDGLEFGDPKKQNELRRLDAMLVKFSKEEQ